MRYSDETIPKTYHELEFRDRFARTRAAQSATEPALIIGQSDGKTGLNRPKTPI